MALDTMSEILSRWALSRCPLPLTMAAIPAASTRGRGEYAGSATIRTPGVSIPGESPAGSESMALMLEADRPQASVDP
jgi:hypothetical protein